MGERSPRVFLDTASQIVDVDLGVFSFFKDASKGSFHSYFESSSRN